MTIRGSGTKSLEGAVESRPPLQETVRATYRRLRMAGLTATEAGNLTAHLHGLHVVEQGWTLQEIEGLLFIQALADRGRIPS